MIYDRFIRILHWGFALGVSLQLLLEEFMKRPKPGRVRDATEAFFFGVHEVIGLMLAVWVIVRAVAMVDDRQSWHRLFPWLSADGRRMLGEEIREVPGWFFGRLKAPQEQDTLAGSVHGLGLLLIAAMAATGTVVFLGMSPDGSMPELVHDVMEVHEALGNLVWIYLVGHVGMALYHQLLGHRSLQRIFSLRDE